MQESRLFRIVYYLLDKGHATATEMAEKFEVSVRTIYRDIDALSGAGIPVYAETGRNGGIYLMRDYILDRMVLSEEEQQEILAALQSFHAIQHNGSSLALAKLSALFHVSFENWLEVDFSKWGERQEGNKKFESLKSAVICHKCVQISYAASCRTVSERVIHPLKLMYKSKGWYLKAFCVERQDYRIFKLDRILDFQILKEEFAPRSFPEQTNILPREYNQVTLRFPEEMAYRVYDEFDMTQVEQQENGDFIVSARMPEDAWLTGFLLSCGTQVEIIEPAYLKEVIAEQAYGIYEKNKAPK